MKTNLTLFTKIATRSFLTWLSVVIPGILLSVVGMIISIYLLKHQESILYWSTLLLLFCIAGFALFPSLASGYTLKKAIFLCWDHKLGDFFIERMSVYVDKILLRFGQKPPASNALFKNELKIEVKKDTDTNKLQKRLLNFLLKKINLDDIDWQAPQPKIKAQILEKVKAFIGEKLEPSPLWIRLAMVLPVVLMILALIYER